MTGRRPRRAQGPSATAATIPGGGVGPVTGPWSRIVWPPVPGTSSASPIWYNPHQALSIPAVAKAVGVIGGQIKQAPMDDYLGVTPQARPRLLDQPDPNAARAWFVQAQVED